MMKLQINAPSKKGEKGIFSTGLKKVEITFHHSPDGGCYPDKEDYTKAGFGPAFVEECSRNSFFKTWFAAANSGDTQTKVEIILNGDERGRRQVFYYGEVAKNWPNHRPRFNEKDRV